MNLSSKSRYAMRAMQFLAESGQEGPQPLRRIAQCGLPLDYLEQLLGCLRRQGLVRSVRGRQGGYLLAKPANEISLGDVIMAVEGPVRLSICEQGDAYCQGRDSCTLQATWGKVSDGILNLMERYSLQDLVMDSARSGNMGDLV